MKTDVIEAGPFERLLTLHVAEPELEDAKNQAARKLSRELKIKGFRPGRAPRPVVERMVGPEALLNEALEEALPALVGSALEETDLDPATTPQIEDVSPHTEGGVDVQVKITLWPQLETLPDLERRITVDYPEVAEEELAEQLDRVRSQYAELEDVNREADEGDFVMINLSAEVDGTAIEEVSATDLLYEVGSRSYIPGLDELLVGVTAGMIKDGPAVLPPSFGERGGEEVSLKVLVKGVKGKKLPDLTDEWVSDYSEFDSVDELRAQLERSLLAMKLNVTQGTYRDGVIDALLQDVDLELPEALVDAEVESSLHNMAHSLQAQGLDLGTYLQVTGMDQNEFIADLRSGAERSLKTRILLDGVAADAAIEVEDDDFEAAIAEMAEASGRDADDMKQALAASGQDRVLAGDILRRKALDRVLEAATPIDDDGNPVDLTIDLGLDEDEDDAVPAGDADNEPDSEKPDEDA